MHGDEPAVIAAKIADMRARRERLGLPPMIYGMAAYAIVRDSAREAAAEVARITDMGDRPPPGFDNFDQWLSGTQLERELKIREYSVSNRGLRPGLDRHARARRGAHRGIRGGRARPAAPADEPAAGGDGALLRAGDPGRPAPRGVNRDPRDARRADRRDRRRRADRRARLAGGRRAGGGEPCRHAVARCAADDRPAARRHADRDRHRARDRGGERRRGHPPRGAARPGPARSSSAAARSCSVRRCSALGRPTRRRWRRSAGAGTPAPGHVAGSGDALLGLIAPNLAAAAAEGAIPPLAIFALLFGVAAARLPPERTRTILDALAPDRRHRPRHRRLGAGARAGRRRRARLHARRAARARGGLGARALCRRRRSRSRRSSGWRCTRWRRSAAAFPLAAFARAALEPQAVAASTQSSLAALPAMLAAARRLTGGRTARRERAAVVLPLAVALFRLAAPASIVIVTLATAQINGTPLDAGDAGDGRRRSRCSAR